MRKNITRTIFPFLFSIFFILFPQTALAKSSIDYDVVVIGAGSGGTAAAIQAARMGATVALVEKSDWVGGQMTGAAVSTMDDKTLTRTGTYKEFIENVREYYKARNTNVNICYWGDDTIAFEPWVGRLLLLDMLEKTGKVNVYLKMAPISAKVSGHKVVSATFEDENKKTLTLHGKVFIDATECGDFIPMTGARYRAGNGVSPKIGKDGIIQDITYVAVVKKYKDGLPEKLKIAPQPPRYSDYLMEFRGVIRKDGSSWPGEYPFNVVVHNAYRAIPDPSEGNGVEIGGGKPSTWPLITKTGVNWANDVPGRFAKIPGLSVEYLEDLKFRGETNREAMLKTLCFIYYMQNELGLKDWSVDNRQDFGGWFENKWDDSKELSEFAHILKHFPPFPYVRESRRIVGVKTMTVTDIMRDPTLRRVTKSIPDAVALGEYPVDIHGVSHSQYLEKDLGETASMIPAWGDGFGGRFQIPVGALIPEKVDGLLAAEKNISVSRAVNGSTRLQPVTMLTGQAAGAMAALAAEKKIQPRELRPIDIQFALWTAKDSISLFSFEDVPVYST
ncbi:MAG: FAD-dependent oxidoreductase, partial [Synergistaceae bacterium]|nr:FAD-dependent oxidoreductase [Synergistaceae bacterium]